MKACLKGFNPEYREDSPTPEQIESLAGYTVLEFGTPWCGHCLAALPAIREVLSGTELPHIKVYDGKGRRLGRVFKVKLWPTLILLNSGKEVARLVRPVLADEVRKLIGQMAD